MIATAAKQNSASAMRGHQDRPGPRHEPDDDTDGEETDEPREAAAVRWRGGAHRCLPDARRNGRDRGTDRGRSEHDAAALLSPGFCRAATTGVATTGAATTGAFTTGAFLATTGLAFTFTGVMAKDISVLLEATTAVRAEVSVTLETRTSLCGWRSAAS